MNKSSLIFYGWFIVAVGFVTMMITYGLRFSFSVFYIAILEEFGQSRAATAGIFSVNFVIYGIVAPFVGALADKVGPKRTILLGAVLLALGAVASSQANSMWHLYLSFGVLAAVGTALTGFVSFSIIISRWFNKNRGAAFGIFNAGMGASLVLSLLAQFLISALSWRQSYLLLGVLPIIVVMPLVAFFVRSRPEDMGLLPNGFTEVMRDENYPTPYEKRPNGTVGGRSVADGTLVSVIKSQRFWALWLTIFCFWGLALSFMWGHQVAYMVQVGYSKAFAAFIFSLFGMLYGAGNLFGFVSDRIGREKTFTLGCIGTLLGTFSLALLQDGPLPWIPYLYVGFFGFGAGISAPTLTSSITDIFAGRSLGVIMGTIIVGYGFGGALAIWLGGYIFDVRGGYGIGFIMVSVSVFFAGILLWVAGPRKYGLISGKRS